MMPKSIKIGTQIWEVSEQKRKHNSDFHEGTYGYTIDKDNTIVLDVEMPSSRKRTTLLHELLHAIGLYEEPLITVLQENPELTNFLLGREDSDNARKAERNN